MNSESSQKVINLLTMARRAGRIVMGHDPVKDKAIDGEVFLILTATDLSEKSKKEVDFFSDSYSVPVLKTEISMEDFHYALGRKTGIIGIIDEGFANQFNKLLS